MTDRCMSTLLQDGIHKVVRGATDFKQVRAVCMREAPSTYLFESDGSVHRNRQFEDEVELSPQEAARLASAPLR